MNLSEIRAEVVRHTWRSDLEDALVDLHVNEACRHIFNMREWWWRDKVQTTDPSTDARITLPSDFSSPIALTVITDDDNTRDALILTPIHKLRQLYDDGDTGEPIHYAIHGGELFLGPAPSEAYGYELVYKIKNTTLADDADTNEAATHLALAVVARASSTLLLGVLHDDAGASRMAAMFSGLIATAEDEDDARRRDLHTGHVQPDSFYHDAAFGVCHPFQ
jgi:hypothetical protein